MKWRGVDKVPMWKTALVVPQVQEENNGRRWYRYDCYRSPLFLFSGVI